VTGDGKSEAEVRRRIQVGANLRNRVEGVMVDRKISRKLKGKVVMSCVTLAHLYNLEMVALTERQHQRLQVCENNWVRRIVGVKRMDELQEKIGVQISLMGRLVKYWLRWAGHFVWRGEERMTKRADRLTLQGRRKRGRP